MAEQQAIVFGGAGFIGSHLIASLVSRYARVVSVDLAEPRFRTAGVEYHKHDVRTPIPIELAQGQPADIFNLAAVHVTPGHEDWEYFDTNVRGAVHVCRFATSTNSQRIVFTSSISVYGPTEEPLDENADLKPTSAYGRSKLAAEEVQKLWQSEDVDRRLTILRPAVIYGLHERGNFTRLARLLSKRIFVFPGRDDTIKSCGYVRDLVNSIFYMAPRHNSVLVYNFCYDSRHTIKDICNVFAEVADYDRPRRIIPIWLMNFLALPFEVMERFGLKTGINRDRVRKLWYSTNVVPAELVRQKFPFAYDLRSSLEDWRRSSTIGKFD